LLPTIEQQYYEQALLLAKPLQLVMAHKQPL
jgi:hypothetical protein